MKKIDKEKEIQTIMKELECTKEEAEEVFQMEEKVRENKTDKIYTQSDEPKKPKQRTKKVDENKKFIIEQLKNAAIEFSDVVEIKNSEREISIEYNGDSYSITLTKHRPKKES